MTLQLEVNKQGEDVFDRVFDLTEVVRDWFRRQLQLPPTSQLDTYELDQAVNEAVVDTFDLAFDPAIHSVIFDGRQNPLRLLVTPLNADETRTVDLDEVLLGWTRRLLDLPEEEPLYGGFVLERAMVDELADTLQFDVGSREDRFVLAYD